MSIDHKGTAPGLIPETPKEPVHFMRCKEETCDSMEATEIRIEGQVHTGQRVYRCTKCGRPSSVQVGGYLNI